MTITTSNPAGVQVNSAAKDSTGAAAVLSSQTAALPNEVIVPDAITANNEGNLESTPVYPGRLIQLRELATGAATVVIADGGTGYAVDDILTDDGAGATAARRTRFIVTSVNSGVIDGIKIHEAGDAGTPAITVGFDRGEYSVEGAATGRATTGGGGSAATVDLTFQSVDEHRFVIADASQTLTVHEDWIDGPAADLNWRISYIIQDAATLTGLGLINKRVSDFTSTRRFQILSGGWFFMGEGVSLETVDNSSTTEADFIVNAGGRFDNGYISAGIPVSGGYMIGTPALAGELVFDSDAGGTGAIVNLYDWFLPNVNNSKVNLQGNVDMRGSKIAFGLFNILMTGDEGARTIRLIDCILEGRGTFDERISVDHDTFIDGLVLLNSRGFSPVILEDLEFRGINFLDNNIRFIELPVPNTAARLNEGWLIRMINPIWNVPIDSQEKLFWLRSIVAAPDIESTMEAWEVFELDVAIAEADGSAVSGAAVHVFEGTVEDAIVNGSSNIDPHGDVNEIPFAGSDAGGNFSMEVVARKFSDNVTTPTFTDGTNGIDFNDNSPSADTIVRNDGGSWITDGFAVGQTVRVTDASSVSDLGTFLISAISASTLTVTEPNDTLSTTAADIGAVVSKCDVAVEARGSFFLRVHRYGFVPFLGARTVIEAAQASVSLGDDVAITEATEATALSNGAGIIVERRPTPVRGPFNIQTNAVDADAGTITLTNYVIPSGLTDGYLVVIAGGRDTATGNHTLPTAVSYGAQSLSLINETLSFDSILSNNGVGVGIWAVAAPTVQDATITVTFGNGDCENRKIVAFYIVNADQSGQPDGILDYVRNSSGEAGEFAVVHLVGDLTTTQDNAMIVNAVFADNNFADRQAPVTEEDIRRAFVVGGAAVPKPLTVSTRLQPVSGAKTIRFRANGRDSTGQGEAALTAAAFSPNADTQPLKVFHYDGGTGTVPTVGEAITVTNGGADTTGILHEFIGDEVAGTMVLESWNGVQPDNNGAISGDTSSVAALADTTGGGSSFNEEYTWLIDADSKAMTTVYDYLAAQMAQLGTSLDPEFRDVILWGEGEQSQLLFFGSSGYFTNRNVARTEGVWVSNRGAGDIAFFTSDSGATFTPPIQVNLTLTGLRDNTEVRVYAVGTTTELAGIENAITGSSDDRSVTFALPASTVVDIRFAHGIAADGNHYIVPDRNSILSFTWPTATSNLPITQVLDRTFDDPV